MHFQSFSDDPKLVRSNASFIRNNRQAIEITFFIKNNNMYEFKVICVMHGMLAVFGPFLIFAKKVWVLHVSRFIRVPVML
ncbi:hypothetical protein COO20_09385 [Thalassospira marina]|uniref:Uncharacterized protein n=1 Tax=Thalassospira marina TaxID=2048283 RepID=A0A2N3KUV9_9PROT|nr:hypothetical protein COO20_09385 [Thalassospira marina]